MGTNKAGNNEENKRANKAANRTVLVLGSGPIRIGQAAEFDYAGTQACRALKEEGCRVVLLNSNPATIQTDSSVADSVYLRPLTPEVVEDILQKERPWGVVATLGGQTGLNLCMDCQRLGLWEKYGCQVLGTDPEAIQRAEAREPFRSAMIAAGEPVVESQGIGTLEEARAFTAQVPYPVILRPDFTLGGTGNSVVWSAEELEDKVAEALEASPVHRALIERYLKGWREIEVEVVRDGDGNSLAVCSMENLDPMGVHTGDSVVVSPVLTLTDRQWQMIRSAALHTVAVLNIRGACNVQFALAPDGESYYIIEVNPRASRSSALASKATGYPIARMATKIALGLKLTEMANPVTGIGSALAEPALDYVVVKYPSWPFDTFPQADPSLGPRMKATGEVLALGRTFAEALMKASRSLERGRALPNPKLRDWNEDELWYHVLTPTNRRVEALAELLRHGVSPETLAQRTDIQPYFIEQIQRIQEAQTALEERGLQDGLALEARKLGFTPRQIAEAAGCDVGSVEALLEQRDCTVGFREVDGCAGESPSGSGYYYGSVGASSDPWEPQPGGVLVLGSGAIRIAQGVEFDYCCVKAVEALRRRGIRAIMANVNPETVSTDHDLSDGLYVEPLTVEDISAVIRREQPRGVLACFGGQTSLRLGLDLAVAGVPLLGPGADVIDAAEDRGRFNGLLKEIGVPEPEGAAVSSMEEGLAAARRLGFPLMVRPSFVIGGVAMQAVFNLKDFSQVLLEAFQAVPGQKIMVDRFIPGRELEVDALCDGPDVLIPGIFEHIDPSGIHSGDSIATFPSFSLTEAQRREILDIVAKISAKLDVHGLLNVQFVLRDGQFWVIEANPRASRTVPIASKISGVPMVDIAVGLALGEKLADAGWGLGLLPLEGIWSVKVPVFSNDKLPGIDPKLGPRMMSTGESLGVADNLADALVEGLRGAGWNPPARGRLLLSVADGSKQEALSVAVQFKALGWHVDGTEGTAKFLNRWGLHAGSVEKHGPLMERLRNGDWDMILNIPGGSGEHTADGAALRRCACSAGILCLHSTAAAIAVAASLSGAGEGR